MPCQKATQSYRNTREIDNLNIADISWEWKWEYQETIIFF